MLAALTPTTGRAGDWLLAAWQQEPRPPARGERGVPPVPVLLGRGGHLGKHRCSLQRGSFAFIAFHCCSWLILRGLCHLEEGGRARGHAVPSGSVAMCVPAPGCHWFVVPVKAPAQGQTGPCTPLGQPPAPSLRSPLPAAWAPPSPLVTCLVVYKTLKLMV